MPVTVPQSTRQAWRDNYNAVPQVVSNKPQVFNAPQMLSVVSSAIDMILDFAQMIDSPRILVEETVVSVIQSSLAPVEETQSLSQSWPPPVEVNKSAVQTSVPPTESNSGILSTELSPLEAGGNTVVTQTALTNLDSQAQLAALLLLLLDEQMGVSQEVTVGVKALQGVCTPA